MFIHLLNTTRLYFISTIRYKHREYLKDTVLLEYKLEATHQAC